MSLVISINLLKKDLLLRIFSEFELKLATIWFSSLWALFLGSIALLIDTFQSILRPVFSAKIVVSFMFQFCSCLLFIMRILHALLEKSNTKVP